MLTEFALPLAIDLDAGPITDLAHEAVPVLVLFVAIAALLVAFDQLDRWIARRGSPVARLLHGGRR